MAQGFLLLLALLFDPQQPPQPPRDVVKPSGGTAGVSGRVTDKDTGAPLRAFTVTVTRRAAADARPFEADTDADGRYAISGLTPGEYHASAAPGEFRASHMGRVFGLGETPRAPFSLPPSFTLKAGETKRDLDFALERTFAIEGRVVNEYGEGLSDIDVSGERTDGQFGGTAPATTDDRGQFRVYSVARGAWRICAQPGNVWPGTPTGGDAMEARFVKTCFPPSGGTGGIEIGSSDVAGVVISMQRDRAYEISGHVLDETGTPVRDARVEIERLEGSFETTASVAPEVVNGAFVARGLTPGEYLVRAGVSEPYDPYSMPGRPPGPRLMGITTLRVEAADVSGVVITASRGADISGRLLFEGRPGTPLSPARFTVTGQRPRDAQRLYRNVAPASASVDANWSFELRRLYGPLFIAVHDKANEWIVQSVRYGGTDITGVSTEFKAAPGKAAIEVTLTNETARVTARAIDPDGTPAAGAVVLMLPADPARWQPGYYAPQAPREDGRFALPPRAPGEYVIAALPGDDALRLMRNPEELREFAARAQRVSLDAGEHQLDVKLVKLYERR